MMMSLGMFVFGLPTVTYQTLQRETNWRHASNSRVGARAGRQYIGPGDDTITLSGWVSPELVGDRASLDELRKMADAGLAYVLVDGTGIVHGVFVIERLSEGQTLFFFNGTPRRIEFSLVLERVDEGTAGNVLGPLALPTPVAATGITF